MKRLLTLLTGLLLFCGAAAAQSDDGLTEYPVKRGVRDARFDKVFSSILTSGAHHFKGLENGNGLKSISDTTYKLKLDFKEKNDATLTCEKDNVNLTIEFKMTDVAFNNFFKNLNAEFPSDFVYTKEFDAGAKQYNYAFFPKLGAKVIPPNYPEKLMMIRDSYGTVLLTFLLFR